MYSERASSTVRKNNKSRFSVVSTRSWQEYGSRWICIAREDLLRPKSNFFKLINGFPLFAYSTSKRDSSRNCTNRSFPPVMPDALPSKRRRQNSHGNQGLRRDCRRFGHYRWLGCERTKREGSRNAGVGGWPPD